MKEINAWSEQFGFIVVRDSAEGYAVLGNYMYEPFKTLDECERFIASMVY